MSHFRFGPCTVGEIFAVVISDVVMGVGVAVDVGVGFIVVVGLGVARVEVAVVAAVGLVVDLALAEVIAAMVVEVAGLVLAVVILAGFSMPFSTAAVRFAAGLPSFRSLRLLCFIFSNCCFFRSSSSNCASIAARNYNKRKKQEARISAAIRAV